MTGRHTRHIVLAVLAIAVVSMTVFAQTEYSLEEIVDLRARAEQGDADARSEQLYKTYTNRTRGNNAN